MNSATRMLTLQGEAGVIEAALDEPPAAALADGAGAAGAGVAVIAHPHPLFGGSMQNKVVQTLARACVQCGWRAVRFNFRGVGGSAGAHDQGRGELRDMLAVVAQAAPANAPLLLAGFSFGAFVASHAITALHGSRPLAGAVLVGTAASRFAVAPVPEALRPRTLVVHGEQDNTVPLSSVLDWARPQFLPVTVAPGVEHFFHGQLPLLKNLVVNHLQALRAAA